MPSRADEGIYKVECCLNVCKGWAGRDLGYVSFCDGANMEIWVLGLLLMSKLPLIYFCLFGCIPTNPV